VVNAATFYLIATYLPTYFQDVLQLSPKVNTIIALTILTLTTVTLPFFGKLGDRICNKKIFIFCAIMIIALIYPLYASMDAYNLFWISLISVLYIIPITCISALLPYLLARLFSTSVRYTSISLSVNLSDGIIGGFTPAIALFLVEWTGNPAAFCWFILVCSIVSLLAYLRIKL
jgi:MHS family proline/betaine transporter-like MFS transporter